MELLPFCLGILSAEVAILGPIIYSGYLLRRGQNTQALPWLRYGYAVSRILPSLRGVAALNLCACHTQLGDYDQAMPFNEEALLRLGRRGESSRNLAIARAYRGILQARMGNFDEAESIFTSILTDNKISSRLRTEVEACAAAGYINQGRFDEAKRLLAGVLEATKPNTVSHALAESNMSVCHFFENNLEEALEMAQRASTRTVSWRWISTLALANCLNYQIELGNLEAARELEGKVLPDVAQMPGYVQSMIFSAVARLALRNAILDRNRERAEANSPHPSRSDSLLDRARDYAERAYPLDPNPNAQARALLIQAEIFATRHNIGRTEALCSEILRLNALDYYKLHAMRLVRSLPDKRLAYVTTTAPEVAVQEIPSSQQS